MEGEIGGHKFKRRINEKCLGQSRRTMIKSKGEFIPVLKYITFFRKGLAKMYKTLLSYIKDLKN